MTDIAVQLDLSGEAWDTVAATVPDRTWQHWFQTWLTQLDPDLSPIDAYEVSVQLTTDAAIAQLNHQYRQQAKPTDVLSFAAIDDAPLPSAVLSAIPFNLGDLIISVDTAQRQCQEHGHSLTEELAWLAAHGLLHLLGWDHPDEAHLQEMLSIQRSLLRHVDLSLNESAYFSTDR